jgi:hypothetical protein
VTAINVYPCLSNYLESTRLLAKLYHMSSVFHFALQVLLETLLAPLGIPCEMQAQKLVGVQSVSHCFSIKSKILKVAMYIIKIQEDPSSHFRTFTSRGTKNSVGNMRN